VACGSLPRLIRIKGIGVAGVLTAVIVGASAPLLAQRPSQRETISALEERIPTLMDSAGVIGLAVAVLRDGRVVWMRGFGLRHVDSAGTITPHTVFEAASLSKPAFAYAVLALANAGILDLDASLSSYVRYDDLAHDPRHVAVTARHVLSHMSGLPNWRPREGVLEFRADPGTEFGYSGEGFMYLQRAVESVMQESAGLVTQALVFEHFNMQRSSFEPTPAAMADYATGHDREGVALEKSWPDRTYAAYGLHTTVSDFSRLLLGVRQEWMQNVPAAVMAVSGEVRLDEPGLGWGLGWGVESTAEGAAIWHWGDNRGFKHYAYLDLATGDGIVIFTNAEPGMAIVPELATHAMGVEPRGLAWLGYPRFGVE
jgi:CubicO group peptidase (beta-lactamase class C family)